MKSILQTRWCEGELAAAIATVAAWSLVGLTLALHNSSASSKRPSHVNKCQAVVGQANSTAASCRIHNQLPGGVANAGSGTLIDALPDGSRGLVLTCAHLFSEGTGQVVVEFPDGRTHGALVVAIDHQADLAALEIARPAAPTVEVNRELSTASQLTACGFGPAGVYRCITGLAIGYLEGAGQTNVRIQGAVRSGDSGGGVFDNRGRLVAVVWGESNGVTYASTGRPLGRFLDRALGRRATGALPSATSPANEANGAVTWCPDGTCPLVGPLAGGGQRTPLFKPVVPESPNGSCQCGDSLAAINARIGALEQRPAAAAPIGEAEPLNGSAESLDWSGMARSAATLATVLLGVSGPAGWGVIAASTVGGWLIGRGLKRRKLRALSSELRVEEAPSQSESSASKLAAQPSPLASTEATAAAAGPFLRDDERIVSLAVDEQAPIERDDREARELLRLSQLEGRDPLQDAVAGRLALDRLDALAESDADPQQVAWADALRRELRERFNEIAPTKFQID
ncbi:S1 family peptidase [Lacipirellula sp.]|uniref:S1 family peptidase n=1 Tax=Lacipirellula sp. TaxID=2691419 RepID=UPI003D13B29E